MITKKQVIICPPTKHSINQILKHQKGDTSFQWAYFGEDVLKCAFMSHHIGDVGQHLKISEKLQETAHSLKESYVDYVGKLSVKYNSFMWWVSSLSEKEPFNSKVFLYICYIKICQDILKSNVNERYFVFFVENRALRRCLVQNMSIFSEYKIYLFESIRHVIQEYFMYVYSMVISKIWFIFFNIYCVLLSKYLYKLNHINHNEKWKNNSEYILLRTIVDQRSFDAKNRYHEIYFGKLAKHLKKKNKNVILFPIILGTVSYRNIIQKISQAKVNFLVPEAFLNISDVFRIVIKTTLKIPQKIEYPTFEGIKISEIVIDGFKKDWVSTHISSVLRYYYAIKRMKLYGIPIDTFIYTYENHISEKVCCSALREFYSSATIIGYQHSTVSNMYLSHFFSEDEKAIMPFPDKVITNGKYTESLFKNSGYDIKKLVCGGAIRYQSLLEEMHKSVLVINKKRDFSNQVILVTPTIGKMESMELILKIVKAFENNDRYKVILKCHPNMPYHHIIKGLGIRSLPKNFILSDETVSKLLKKSDVLLYASSATCLEALALGVPVIHIESDYLIDLDPLGVQPEIRMSVSSTNEIIDCVNKILDDKNYIVVENKGKWYQIVDEMFGKVNDEVYDCFFRKTISYTGGNQL